MNGSPIRASAAPSFLLEILSFLLNYIFVMTSKIPVRPHYYDISIVKEAVDIKNNFKIFHDEVVNVYKDFKTIKNDYYFEDIVRTEPEWTRFYLKWLNDIEPEARRLCPKSSALIDSMPNVRIAMFSVLKPGAKILLHKGPHRGCLRLHLGLITPNSDDCFLNIAGKSYSWRDGEVILWDDSYPHYVENNTDKYRVILFCDIVRPMNCVGTALNNLLLNLLSKYAMKN
jgi:beta-hydroxylase|tara:strand:- start:121 stop:804 length:684 start_codon:yes stop_codon:yes gene_type:complete